MGEGICSKGGVSGGLVHWPLAALVFGSHSTSVHQVVPLSPLTMQVYLMSFSLRSAPSHILLVR